MDAGVGALGQSVFGQHRQGGLAPLEGITVAASQRQFDVSTQVGMTIGRQDR